ASVRGWNFGHSSGQDRRRDEPATVRSQAQSMSVAIAASESRIRDANIAEEAANLTILNQSGLAALAQANQNSLSAPTLIQRSWKARPNFRLLLWKRQSNC